MPSVMVEVPVSPVAPAAELAAHKPHRMSIISKFILKKSPANVNERPISHVPLLSPNASLHPATQSLHPKSPTEPLSDESIEEEFASVYRTIVAHVHKFYITSQLEKGAHQSAIEHATTGLGVSWRQVLPLLENGQTRLGTLAMCIAWTILSRSLLLKLGLSSIPGSTFLPPEIVECFQSFSVGKGAIVPGGDEKCSIDLAAVSQWKKMTAALLRETYVDNAFSHFDSRTLNIERGLNDLHSLLRAYSDTSREATEARMADLREVLKHGARFAFSLFGTPCFWQFDWKTGFEETEDEKDDWQGTPPRPEETSLAPSQVVIWPTLVKLMDSEGYLVGERASSRFGKKVFLDEFV